MTDISLYLHLPFCLRRCSYCSFVSFANREADIHSYIEALVKEIALTCKKRQTVKTIYFGGGTPSLLPSELVIKLLDQISRFYTIDALAEVTLEANPGTVDATYLKRLRAAGINRLSLGLQSLDDRELDLLGRSHSSYQVLQAVSQARDAGFNNLNLDLIYAIPGRQLSQWEKMLQRVLDLGAEHLSFYGLTIDKDTPMGAACDRGEITQVDPDHAAAEYENILTLLAATSYRQYEISNWAVPGAESRHNLIYWRRGEYRGLGTGAHSFIDNYRLANTDEFDEYIRYLGIDQCPAVTSEFIDSQAALAESIILGLRINEGVNIKDIERQFKIDFFKRFNTEISELTDFGLLEVKAGSLRLTDRGRLLGNEVFIRFLP